MSNQIFVASARFFVMSHLLSVTLLSTSSYKIRSIRLIFSNLLQIHLSNASNLLIVSFLSVHVSHPYNTTFHTIAFMIPFFSSKLKLLISNIFFLLNAAFPIAILFFTSSTLLSFVNISLPTFKIAYLFYAWFFKTMFISFSAFFEIFITFVFFIFTFIP